MKNSKPIMAALMFLAGCGQQKSAPPTEIILATGAARAVAYEDYGLHSSCDGEEATLDETLALFDAMNWSGDAFMSLTVGDDNLLQIVRHDEARFLVELTDDNPEMIFLQRFASQQECREIIRTVFGRERLDSTFLVDYYPVPIRTKKLEQVMKDGN